MYLEYFGLREKPFSITADPAFLYLSPQHQEAMSHMLYGIQERKGFVEITGEVGTGKTTLCKAVLRQLESDTRTALILNSNLSELQLLQTMIQDFGMNPMKHDRFSLFNQLNQFLLEQAEEGKNIVVLIDEAQNLSTRLLEQIRMLSNLETDKDKLIQIVLIGQPQLRDKLNRPDLEQLKQRIAVRCIINPLKEADVANYVNHRVRTAGNETISWTDSSIQRIHGLSKGIPRMINQICDRCLLAGYIYKSHEITPEIVERSYKELRGDIQADESMEAVGHESD